MGNSRRTSVESLVALAIVLVVSSTPERASAQASPAPDPPTGPQIFALALATWSAQREPAFLSYDVVATLDRKGRTRNEHDRILFRSSDRTAITRTEPRTLSFGSPRFIPDVAFRLVPRFAGSYDGTLDDALPPTPAASPLAVIGGARATVKRYDVSLIGRETYRNQAVFHLKLVPLFDPIRNSVREMWVDAETFVTLKLIDEASYGVGPARGRFLLNAEYGQFRGFSLLQRVRTSGTLRFGLFSFGGNVDVRFANITVPPQNPPNACFDRAGYLAHESECDAILP